MVNKGATGYKRIALATVYFWQGFVAAFRYEAAFRQELAISIFGFVVAIFLARNAVEFLLLAVPLLSMLLVEMINSAIEAVEAVVDCLGEEHHELSGRAKDMGSATVFVALCIVGLSWIVILGDRFLD